MPAFKLTQLRHFSTVADLKSIGIAARVLHISQPALTRSIQRLEKEVEGPLFERSSRGVELTPRGTALLPYVRSMLDEADRATEQVRGFAGQRRMQIRFGASANFAERIGLDIVADFVDAYPMSTVAISGGTAEQLISKLSASELDLAVAVTWGTTLQMALAKDFELASELLTELTVGVFAPADHHLAGCRNVSLDVLAKERWAVPHGLSLSYIFQDAFISRELPAPLQAVNSSDMRQLLSLTERLGLLLIIPQHVVADAGVGDRLVPVGCPALELRYRVNLVTRRRGTEAAGFSEFRKRVRQHFLTAELA